MTCGKLNFGWCILALLGVSLSAPLAFAQKPDEVKPEKEKPAAEQPTSQGAFSELCKSAQPKMVKVFGAGAGRVDGFATGIIVSDDGKILTTQGVFLDGREVRVVTSDGVSHNATILRRNRVSQLSLLRM